MKKWWKEKGWLTWLLLVLLLGTAALRHLEDVKDGALESGDYWLVQSFWLLAVCVLAGTAAAGYAFCRGKRWNLERTYALCVLGLGTLYLFVLPPLSAPDEVAHYISAYKLSSQIMGKEAVQEYGLVYIRKEDAFIEDIYDAAGEGEDDPEKRVVLGQELTEDTYRQIHSRGLFGAEKEGREVSNIWPVQTTPLAYLPQALGFTLARLLSFTGIGLLFMGRFANLLFFTGMGYLAVKRLPFCKEVLFGVSLLPMTLHLVSSLSYDVMILALSFYLTAYVLSLAYEKERCRLTDVVCLALLAAVLVPCKMVYGCLLGLCFLIPARKLGGWKSYVLSAVFVAAAALAAVLVVNSQVLAVYTAESSTYVDWAAEPGYSFSQILTSQRLVLDMIYGTLVWQSQHYFLTMIGASLGNLDPVLDVPFPVIGLLVVCLGVLALKKPGESSPLGRLQKLWCALLAAGCGLAVLLSMLVTYTPVSSKIISGVQGRYFLPILPLLLLALKNNRVVCTGNYDRTCLYLMFCANGYALLRLFGIVSMRI